VAAGDAWWGLKTTQGKVMYINYEVLEDELQKRMTWIMQEKSIPDTALESVTVWNLRGHAGDLTKQREALLSQMRDENYSLIIFDPIYKALGPRDENKAGDINSLFNEVETLAKESGAAVVISHHFSKGNQAGKESMDRISGSGVFGRAADAILIVTKHESDGVFTVECDLRNFKRVDPFCIEWSAPLMQRNASLNPADLKKPGAANTKCTPEQALAVLGDRELTLAQWRTNTKQLYGIKDRCFDGKKAQLLQKNLIEEVDDKWRKRIAA
jgi:hypothetical protein